MAKVTTKCEGTPGAHYVSPLSFFTSQPNSTIALLGLSAVCALTVAELLGGVSSELSELVLSMETQEVEFSSLTKDFMQTLQRGREAHNGQRQPPQPLEQSTTHWGSNHHC